jgi:hypothetical protein
MVEPPFSHVTQFGQTSMLVCCLSSVRNTVKSYRGHQTDFPYYRSPITGLGPSKPKIPPGVMPSKAPNANRLVPAWKFCGEATRMRRATIGPLHLRYLFWGLTNSGVIVYSSDYRNTEGGYYDLHALSGLYGERSLHGSSGEFRRYVADRVALS